MDGSLNARIAAARCTTPEAREAYRRLLENGAGEISKRKRCPHCGGAGVLISEYQPACGKYAVYVKCYCCGSRGGERTCREYPPRAGWQNDACREAVAEWNKRI